MIRSWLKRRLLWPSSTYPLSATISLPGQPAALRYFNPRSPTDYQALKAILTDDQVQHWMTHVGAMSLADYQDWCYTLTPESILYAILSASPNLDRQTVHGFIYLYSGKEEKSLIQTLIARQVLPPSPPAYLEVSFARNRFVANSPLFPGLISSALRLACNQHPDNGIYASIDPQNLAAQRVIQASGFTYRGSMPYTPASKTNDAIYLLERLKLNQLLNRSNPPFGIHEN